MSVDNLRKALKCVATRLRVMSKDGLKEPQMRWLGHTIDIADNALDGTDDAAREMLQSETLEQRDLRNSELGAVMRGKAVAK